MINRRRSAVRCASRSLRVSSQDCLIDHHAGRIAGEATSRRAAASVARPSDRSAGSGSSHRREWAPAATCARIADCRTSGSVISTCSPGLESPHHHAQSAEDPLVTTTLRGPHTVTLRIETRDGFAQFREPERRGIGQLALFQRPDARFDDRPRRRKSGSLRID